MWTHDSSPSLSSISTRGEIVRRKCIIASNAFLAVEIALGIIFTVLLRMGFLRIGGIVEWVMAFLFTGYFWAFVGVLNVNGGEGEEEEEDSREREGEETPLLR